MLTLVRGHGGQGEGAGVETQESEPGGGPAPLTVLQRPCPLRTVLGRPHGAHRRGSGWRHLRIEPGPLVWMGVGGPWGWGGSSVAAGVKGQG